MNPLYFDRDQNNELKLKPVVEIFGWPILNYLTINVYLEFRTIH